ncbi:MAG TPA: thioredoxin-dependent thiol peroxidase [Nitrososphaeraceae archaeon]|nr:thioredoxin-dependent thiol peroxidase [Nitrososphaeraceae archaeon]
MNKEDIEQQQQQQQLTEGDIAPDFISSDSNGHRFKLSDFRRKKKVIIYFYPKDFTPGCTTEAMEFTKDYNKIKDANIEIIGVSPDTDESHKKFRQKLNIPYLLSADPQNEISKKYGVYGPKSFMGKENIGVNRSTFLVDINGKIIRIFPKVKPAGHSREVIDCFRRGEDT